jgi:hypothetical protein
MELLFDDAPAGHAGASKAWARFLVEGAPHGRLRSGVRFSIHDGVTRIADVEVLD